MYFLVVIVLTTLPFVVGVFALLFVGLRDDMALFEQGNRRANTFIKVFLVDVDPVDVSRLFPDLDAFKNLLLVDFERREVIWSKHIRWTVETRQFHELAHDFRRFQTTPQSHFDILPMFTHPLWIKSIRACHWQELLPWNKLWFAIIELD